MADSSLPSRVLNSPRLGFGVTTVALVALASGGTGLLVAQGTKQLQPEAPQLAAPRTSTPPARPVVVDRAPGSLLLPPALVDGTARAIHRALVPAPRQARRTVTAPLVPASPPEVVVVPPASEPPVLEPPVLEPPVAEPRVVAPEIEPDAKPGKTGKGHRSQPTHPGNKGKHLGQLKH